MNDRVGASPPHALSSNNPEAGALYGYTYKQNATTVAASANSVGIKQSPYFATHVRTSTKRKNIMLRN